MGIGVKMLSGDVILLKEATMEQFVEYLNRARMVQGEYIWVENSLINIRQIEYAADGKTPIIKAERETAHWISTENGFKCSNCGETERYIDSPYCKWCGAKMEGTEDV